MQKSKWIVSARWDLCFFTGSVLLTYAYYALYKGLLLLSPENFFHKYAAIIATLVFYSLFDHPHIFQTFSRTHADGIEFARRRTSYTLGLLLLVLSGFTLKPLGFDTHFDVFLNIYGIWHILRQNSGFLKLYKKKTEGLKIIDSYLDDILLYGTVILALLIRLSDHSRTALEWIPHIDISHEIFQKIFFLLIAIYALRQLYLLKIQSLHLPKLLFLIAIVSTYYFTYAISDPPFGLLVALETIYHDVQYQGWIIHFQKNRFGKDVWHRWLFYSLVYGCVFGCVAVYSFISPWGEYLFSPFMMLVLFHYYIDGKIWRFSKSPELHYLN